jgi:hypothetical protein
MSPIAAWFLLPMGLGLAAFAVRGAMRGWLPNGSKGLREGEGVSRADQPVGFWFFFALYFGGGLYVALLALRVLSASGAS